MTDDTDPMLDAVTNTVPAILVTLENFEQVQRHMHPGRYEELAEFVAPLTESLQAAFTEFSQVEFPEDLHPFRDCIANAATYALRACDGVQSAGQGDRIGNDSGMGSMMKAMRAFCRAQEEIYPLAPVLQPVSQYFLTPDARSDRATLDSYTGLSPQTLRGLMHAENERTTRGGYSLYVPENLSGGEGVPLVVALHGGTGHGADFLWSWLREARTSGFILLAPTSQGDTWSLMGDDIDLAHLLGLVAQLKEHLPIDPDHVLLTGMSDGGTYTLLAGLNEASPFTHLAPFSGVLHPDIVMSGNLRHAEGRPIYLVHGTEDWMFPVETAWMARQELEQAGARLEFRMIDGLSHTYARTEHPALLDWFGAAPVARSGR